jgi:hypothetical protein
MSNKRRPLSRRTRRTPSASALATVGGANMKLPEQMLCAALLVLAVVVAGCSNPDENRIKCTVEKYKDTVYAEWGNDKSGKRWEHRFDGVRVRMERAGEVKRAWFVQPWFPSLAHPRREFPEVGETFYLKSLPENSMVVRTEEPSYWYYEVDRSE